MTSPVRSSVFSLLPARSHLLRGFLLAALLSLAFLAATAYTSAATLLSRVSETDVMRAASGGAWSGQIGREIAYFVVAQIVLHLALAAFAWVLACASAIIFPTAREKFVRIVLGWFCLLAGATLVYNALWFPRTLLGAYYHDALTPSVGPLAIGQVLYLGVLTAAVITVASAAAVAMKRSQSIAWRRALTIGLPIAAFGLGSAIWASERSGGISSADQARPNVIILGIDSLRLEQLKRFGGTGVTPNLDRFLAEADVVKETTTPAARTFSSWVAILTGRSPTVTGARFNLADRRIVAANPTLADVLRGSGYRTIYSTDEVRYANIDASYGFDQVVTPPIGASDFLIGTYNELPLASVVINTRLGQLLFPFSYGNRGVATMFQPRTYLSRVDREVSFDGPTLFIAHLTASHWPYYTSETPFGVSQQQHADDRPMYRIGLQTADSMFGQMVALLRGKGALDNAIVVVLSDHGEALGLPSDAFFKQTSVVEGMRAPLKVVDFGHGQSVLSPSQYHVLLSFRAFGQKPAFAASGRDLAAASTVEDIAPTILDLLRMPGDPLSVTGKSLAPALRSEPGAARSVATDRIRFTETDLKVLPNPNGGVDEVATAKQNAMFFEVDPQTARLHIRTRYAPLAIAYKERAAFTKDHLLAAMPAGPDAHQYLFFDLATGSGRLLMGRPGDESAEAQRLWDAMVDHYGNELKPAVSITPADWPRIEKEWGEFLATRTAAATVAVASH